jgi:hypothetical protein
LSLGWTPQCAKDTTRTENVLINESVRQPYLVTTKLRFLHCTICTVSSISRHNRRSAASGQNADLTAIRRGHASQEWPARRSTGLRAGGDKDVLFVSYAPEDGDRAAWVAQTLAAHFPGQVSAPILAGQLSGIDDLEAQISGAEGFLMLLSPDFLASPRCRRERALALLHEQQLRQDHPGAQFVHVARIRPTEMVPAGLPAEAEWLDLTSPAGDDQALRDLAVRLRETAGSAVGAQAGSGAVRFQNREQELARVRQKIANVAGPHFWLVIGPPQLGKSWFLDQLGDRNSPPGPGEWTIRLADVQAVAPQRRGEIGSLLRLLLDQQMPGDPGEATWRAIAQRIVRSGHYHLWLIDSAELLTDTAGAALRQAVSAIHNLVSSVGIEEVRLAVVVASRRDKEWRGQLPSPRPEVLQLTGFPREVVRTAMLDLAREMGRAEQGVREIADRVHQLSEGLPALLGRSMAWIRHRRWFEAEMLKAEPFFTELTKPYVDELLTPESLLLGEHDADTAGAAVTVLGEALRVLAPYRLFTQAHLRHHREADPTLATVIAQAGWDLGRLWQATSDLALLTRPMVEPWKQIQPQVRRLLFRHYYATKRQRWDAHLRARSYTRSRFDQVNGKEQAIAMVEYLWHEAARLRLEDAPHYGEQLVDAARDLSVRLRESGMLQPEELRDFGVVRLSQDEEFQETVADQAISDEITEAIIAP